jgi:predicted small lipoprotein YifL
MHERVSRRALTGLAVAVLLAAVLAALAGCGSKEPAYTPQTREEFRPLVDLGSQVILSSDQDKLISQYGYPSHFFITLDPLTGDRVETWTYFPLKQSYTFHDGRQMRKETVEDQSAEYPPTTLKPEDFGSTLSLTEAGQMLGEPYQSSDFKNEEGDGVIILFYDGAILDYTNGKFSGVDTMVHRFSDFPQTTFP